MLQFLKRAFRPPAPQATSLDAPIEAQIDVPAAAPARPRRPHDGTPTWADLTEQLDPALLPPLDRPGVDDGSLTPQQREWRQTGVVSLPQFLPDDLIDAYVAVRAKAAGPGGWHMPTTYLHVPEMRALALYPPLMAMMETLVGEPMMLHLALTGWISTQRAWHQDDYLNPSHVNSWYAAVWMALDDIHPDSGPFEYLSGSHTWPLLRQDKVIPFMTDAEQDFLDPVTNTNPWPSLSERFVVPAVEQQIATASLPVTPFLARRGDVLIWHGRLMHRGSIATIPGMERRSLITHYSGVNHRGDMPNRTTDPAGSTYALFDHELK